MLSFPTWKNESVTMLFPSPKLPSYSQLPMHLRDSEESEHKHLVGSKDNMNIEYKMWFPYVDLRKWEAWDGLGFKSMKDVKMALTAKLCWQLAGLQQMRTRGGLKLMLLRIWNRLLHAGVKGPFKFWSI